MAKVVWNNSHISARRGASFRPASVGHCAISALFLLGVNSAFAADISNGNGALLPTFAQDDIWTRPYMLGDLGRSALKAQGIDLSMGGVNETVYNVSGGYRNVVDQASQFALGAKFDLEKLANWQGAMIGVTFVDRFGQNQAALAGIETLQLTNEVWGRGNIVRLTEFYLQQKLFDDRLEVKVGRLPVGGDFFFQHCDFLYLGLCGGQPGNILGSYIYNWPISQWAGVVKFNITNELAFRYGIFDLNPLYLSLTPNYALLPTYPSHSIGALNMFELNWKPSWSGRASDWRLGGWYANVTADQVVTNVNGMPALTSGLPSGAPHDQAVGRNGFYYSIYQQVTAPPKGDEKHGLYVFSNGAVGDAATSFLNWQVNGGIIYHGPFDWRPKDEVGLGASATNVNPRVANAEILANALGRGRAMSSTPRPGSRPGMACRSPAG